jgi:uncharacterized Ntn-hydrolase superfamily protein
VREPAVAPGRVSHEDAPVTYSVVARDPDTGAFGVAVQSHYFSVGAVVPWVEAGVGAVATQAFAEPSYGPLGLERMRSGQPARAALAALVAADPASGTRQVAMVDNTGEAAAHTGSGCVEHAGARRGPGWSVQGNMLRTAEVPDAMAEAFAGASGDLLDRLLATLDAAEAAGGDVRGQQSAAIVVSAAAPDAAASMVPALRLQVEDHEQPLVELRRLVNMHRGFELLNASFERVQAGDLDGLVPELERALELAPASDDIRFRLAASLTLFGDPRGRPMLDDLFAANPGWRELIPRLKAVGAIPDLPGVVELLTGTA